MAVRERVTQSDVKTEVVSDPPNETDQSGYRVELTEADGSTNLLMNIGCRPPTSGQTMCAKAACRPIAQTWMKSTIARPL